MADDVAEALWWAPDGQHEGRGGRADAVVAREDESPCRAGNSAPASANHWQADRPQTHDHHAASDCVAGDPLRIGATLQVKDDNCHARTPCMQAGNDCLKGLLSGVLVHLNVRAATVVNQEPSCAGPNTRHLAVLEEVHGVGLSNGVRGVPERGQRLPRVLLRLLGAALEHVAHGGGACGHGLGGLVHVLQQRCRLLGRLQALVDRLALLGEPCVCERDQGSRLPLLASHVLVELDRLRRRVQRVLAGRLGVAKQELRRSLPRLGRALGQGHNLLCRPQRVGGLALDEADLALHGHGGHLAQRVARALAQAHGLLGRLGRGAGLVVGQVELGHDANRQAVLLLLAGVLLELRQLLGCDQSAIEVPLHRACADKGKQRIRLRLLALQLPEDGEGLARGPHGVLGLTSEDVGVGEQALCEGLASLDAKILEDGKQALRGLHRRRELAALQLLGHGAAQVLQGLHGDGVGLAKLGLRDHALATLHQALSVLDSLAGLRRCQLG
mmetsp:Transcript_101385/g.295373  ORF Transcript_101385/g.295373 Transcript_101385/m.295373 type:complete len:500 (+) Transcript_101385:455-1954(+)